MGDDEQAVPVTKQSRTQGGLPGRPYIITISRGDKLGILVGIRTDGTIEYGEGYEPDEAARAFWDSVARVGLFAWADHKLANIAATAVSLVPPHQDAELGAACQCLTCALFREYAAWKTQKHIPGAWHMQLMLGGQLTDVL